MNNQPIGILIADDHAMVRSAISTWIHTIPELSLVGEASNGEEAISRASLLKPDIVLMDLMMPKVDGIAATRAIIQKQPRVKILIVTSFTEKNRAVEAIQAGAQGFILKDASLDELLDAILAIFKGRSWFSAELARSLVGETGTEGKSRADNDIEALTAREMDVLKLLAEGKSDQEISETLVIGQSTIRFHLHQILGKLQAENRTQAALIAIRKGWVQI